LSTLSIDAGDDDVVGWPRVLYSDSELPFVSLGCQIVCF
jgi:hypothetical protein